MDDRERQGDVIGYFRRLGPICQPSEVSLVQRSAPERLGAKKPTVKSPRLATVLGGGHLFGVIRRSRQLHFRFIWNIHNPSVCLSSGMSASVKGESFETRREYDAGPGLGDIDSPWLFEDLPEWYRGPQDQGLW